VGGRHALDRLACAEKAAQDVGGEHALQARGIHLLQTHLALEHAGVVDQHVEAAELAVDRREQGGNLFFVGHIGCDRDRSATGLANPLRQLFGRVGALPIVQAHRIAATGCQLGGGGADPAAGTGDEHDLVHFVLR